ncbi:MAG TPA: glycosyltransferase [Candidatus Andersenbacteria bacterium]|nr:glycosyltransferase [Candidatus Andersenbacteria bacterium]
MSAGLYIAQYENFFLKHVPSDASYEDALAIFRQHAMLYPSRFCLEMENLQVFAEDIIPDFPSMQNIWKAQHGNGNESILFQQIKYYAPEVIYFQELDVIPHAIRKQLKATFPFIKIITGFKGFPPKVFSDYSDLDHVFISYPHFIEAWERAGVPTTILPHCFDPGTNVITSPYSQKKYDVTFVGSTGFGNLSQEGRYTDLKEIMEKSPLEIWGKEQIKNTPYYILKGICLRLLGHFPPRLLRAAYHKINNEKLKLFMRDALLVREGIIQAFDWYLFKRPLQALFPGRFYTPVVGSEYLSIIGKSKISLNRHTDEQWEGGNIRTFEITGMGSCLLTDDRSPLRTLFRNDEIVFYSSAHECVEKIVYLLNHEHERAAIASRGRARTLQDHTTAHRCKKIKQVLQKMI